jgi:hypothetical protein
LTYCADADIPELTCQATTIDSWGAGLLAYFDTGAICNGPTEAINLLTNKNRNWSALVRRGWLISAPVR